MDVKIAWLTVNRNCNLFCDWCYAKEFLEKDSKMDYELSTKLIDMALTAGIKKIYLIGGEPTIHPRLFDILRYIKSYNVEIVIVTNGILLADLEFCEKIKSLNYEHLHFGISLKGSSEQEYLENCGQEAFRNVLTGIRNCEAYGFRYSLSYVLTTDNIEHIDTFSEKIREYNINKPIAFALCNAMITQDGEAIINVQHPLKIERVFAEKYTAVSRSLDDKFALHQIFPLCQCSQELMDTMVEKNQLYTSCHIHARSGVVFDVDGSLLLCNHLAGFSFGQFGKDFWDFDSFCSYWNSEYVTNLHRKFTTMPSEECQNCEVSSKCGGGCCVQWFSNNFTSYKEYQHITKH